MDHSFTTTTFKSDQEHHHHHPNDIQSIKRQLEGILGESFCKYWTLLDEFLCRKIIKCEFDHFVLQLIPTNYIWLHNDFVTSILAKIATSSSSSSYNFLKTSCEKDSDAVASKEDFNQNDAQSESDLEIEEAPTTPTFKTSNFDFNFADKQSLRANLRIHAKYAPFFISNGMIEMETRKKFEKFTSEFSTGRCILEGDLVDTHSLALRLSEAQILFGMNAEVEPESIELLYRGLEVHLKNVLAGIATANIPLESRVLRSDSSQVTTTEDVSKESLPLSACQIKTALEARPSLLGEDCICLEYFNL